VAATGLIFVATWVVPLLRRLDLMSVFSYLETRFHPSIRMLASALAIVMQIGSCMSVVLFLPVLAIATITGLDVFWSVLIKGCVTILYTALGGKKAVIWTDFVQVFVMFGGALFAIGFCVYQLDGGWGEFVRVAAAEDKSKLFDFSFDPTKATVWGFIFLVAFDVVLTFPKVQVLMQHVLSTKSVRDADRSLWAFGLIMIPGGFMFYAIGTALYAFYKAYPERMNPLLSIDATIPLFIAAESQLAGGRHRHRLGHCADDLGLDPQADAPVLLPGFFDPGVHRHRLRRQPLLSATATFAQGPDHPRRPAGHILMPRAVWLG